MNDVYEQHDAAFARVSAYVILQDGKRVATVAFKLPADGAGRLYCYVHWLGEEMVRGFANGYGYDKRSAAASAAARKLSSPYDQAGEVPAADHPSWVKFRDALAEDGGRSWDRALEDAGFVVWQAV